MKIIYFCIFLLSTSILFSQGIAINETGDNPDASAILDVSSTDKGFLPPRMTEVQRDAIASPADGLIVYNLDTDCLNFYDGDEWINMCELGGPSADDPVYCGGTPTEVVEISHAGQVWMDRNLGASQAATSDDDVAAYGDLYQWGRFADGHQCRDSKVLNTVNGIFDNNRPNVPFFQINNVAPNDWLTPQEDDLWDGLAAVNNPCPEGFRIPTEAEWATAGAGSDNLNDFFTNLGITAAGYRVHSSGLIDSDGFAGRYWTSNINLANARAINIVGGGSAAVNNQRAQGSSVRCLKH